MVVVVAVFGDTVVAVVVVPTVVVGGSGVVLHFAPSSHMALYKESVQKSSWSSQQFEWQDFKLKSYGVSQES